MDLEAYIISTFTLIQFNNTPLKSVLQKQQLNEQLKTSLDHFCSHYNLAISLNEIKPPAIWYP